MTRKLTIAALALGFSMAATAAFACGPDGCGKDKDGKPACCCEKMKGDHAGHGQKPDGQKPDGQKPAAPQDGAHKDHKH